MDLEQPKHPEFATVTAKIGPERHGMRLQDALPGLFPSFLPSRKSCKKAIERGRIALNGVPSATARVVQTGDEIAYLPDASVPPPPGARAPAILKWHRPPGADHLFVWKPAGMATSGHGRFHLAGLLAHWAHAGTPDQKSTLQALRPDAMRWPHPVHRLDRATTGWVCIALTLKNAQGISAAFAEHSVKKTYLALVAGTMTGQGESRHPLNGKPAHTAWRALASGPLPVHGTATLLEVKPTTGRTHQIRKHCTLLGHPIVGEDRYPLVGADETAPPRYSGQGLFLSAVKLEVPSGTHGAPSEASAGAPKKFKRISWVKATLDEGQATEAS
ncbi:RluA family pseudouridine synthase [Flavobacteriales bacterium]|nr:RluA family pseudouridine synthase [Flavobacteriales bacterium]